MITYNPIQQIDMLSFLLSWSSSQPPPVSFRVYREGVEVYSVTSDDGTGEYLLTVGVGEFPFVEVLDQDCSRPSIAFPGRLTLNWHSVSGAESYQIQQYDSGWLTKQTQIDEGQGVFLYSSDWLDDVTTYEFRIVPVDSVGNLGTPITFSAEMVRHPDVPAVTYSYDDVTNHVTIS
jgi:hypothetical protein